MESSISGPVPIRKPVAVSMWLGCAFFLAMPVACRDQPYELCPSTGRTCAPGYVCTFDGNACVAAGCGDGVVDPGEVCDDGNDSILDGCIPDCNAVDEPLGNGSDGDYTAAAADEIMNSYSALTADASPGADQVTVADGALFTKGDLIIVWQVQAGSYGSGDQSRIDLSATSAGHYELARVVAVEGNDLTISPALPVAYDITKGTAQVVRVPEYQDLTVPSGASLTAQAWDGAAGGLLAFVASGSVTVDGALDVSGKGFRGGDVTNSSEPDNADFPDDPDCRYMGHRGEGLERSASVGPVGCGMRNKANGGGGGGQVNAGGGGGGHMGEGSEGGNTKDAAYEYGGVGGAFFLTPLSVDERLLLGGGGGGGQADEGNGTAGAPGGGVIWFRAATLTGSGSIQANGATAASSPSDGAGGGGAGGDILVQVAGTAECGAMSATGGNGGSITGGSVGVDVGAGGGAGGGRVRLGATDASLCPITADGGLGGARGVYPASQGDGAAGQATLIPAL